MKKLLVVCCLLLIATSLFAVELKPYKYGDSRYFFIVDENANATVLGEPFNSGTLDQTGYLSQTDTYILFNLNNMYSELVLDVGVTDNYTSSYVSKIDFYVDGVKEKTVSLNCDSMPEEIIVPLNYKRQLKIYTDFEGYGGSIFFTNLDFH